MNLVAVCRRNEEEMNNVADQFDIEKRYTHYDELLKDPEIDAVFVGTPNQWHVPVALEAVKRDKHVLVTKPLADSEAAAKRLVKAAEASGVVNMMSLSTRFGPACSYLSKLSRERYFGELYYARARSVRRSGIPAWNLGFIREGGGAFRDMGVHALDAVWAILGFPTPATVTGVSGAKFGPRGIHYMRTGTVPRSISSQFEADDYAGGFIRFENGIGLQIEEIAFAGVVPQELVPLGTHAVMPRRAAPVGVEHRMAPVLDLAAFAMAFGAGVGDDLAATVAGRAGALDREEALSGAHAARAVTGSAEGFLHRALGLGLLIRHGLYVTSLIFANSVPLLACSIAISRVSMKSRN